MVALRHGHTCQGEPQSPGNPLDVQGVRPGGPGDHRAVALQDPEPLAVMVRDLDDPMAIVKILDSLEFHCNSPFRGNPNSPCHTILAIYVPNVNSNVTH